jgi:general secretion pathway protein A
MYESHFGFDARPFALTPDPRFLFPSRQHRLALTMLEYGLDSQAPLLLLTGEVGSGKTTLVRRLIRDLDGGVCVGLISHTHSRNHSLLGWALSALEIAPRDDSEVAAYEALVDRCVAAYGRGQRTLLIVDEAQNLSEAVLEELRLLTNINSEQDLVLQILLVGQPELRTTLAQPGMRQIAQRIAADYHLRPLSAEDTVGYVRHRLATAGGSPELFTPDAIDAVHRRTDGVPRLVNQLCDYALVYAYADGQSRVTGDLIAQVVADRATFGALPIFALSEGEGMPAAEARLS